MMFIVPWDGGIFLFLSPILLFLFRRFFETKFKFMFTLVIMATLAPVELAGEITQTDVAFLRCNYPDDFLRCVVFLALYFRCLISLWQWR